MCRLCGLCKFVQTKSGQGIVESPSEADAAETSLGLDSELAAEKRVVSRLGVGVEREVNALQVPASFASQYYDLHYHVGFVRTRLKSAVPV